MAHYSTEWHGPSKVTNDLSDLKGDYGLLSTVRRLWYRNTDSSTGSSDLTNAIKGTAAATGEADIDEYAITSNLAVVSGESDYTAYLRSSNFQFNIPAEATIVGVKIRWKGQSTSESGEVMDHHLYMVVDGSYSLAAEAAETPDDKGPDGAGSDAGLQSTSDGAWLADKSLLGARQFTAANSEYFNIASNANLQTGDTDFAFSMWVYPDTSTTDMSLVTKYSGSTATSEYYIELNTSLNVRVRMSPESETVITGSGTLTEDTWNHVVVEHDNGTGMRFTINGGATETIAYTGGNSVETVDFRVGRRGAYNPLYLNGRLARLGFWKKVMSSAEISQLYNDGVGLAYASLDSTLKTSLISYWDLDEANGNATDSHTNAYHLTDNNSVTAAGGTLDYELRQTTGSDDGSLGGYPIDQLTPAKVNSSSFGFVLSAQKERDNASAPWWDDYSGSPQHPSLEHTRMRVWYDISTPDNGNLRSSILSNWSGGLNSSYDETLWDPSGGQDDGTANTGDTGRWLQKSTKRHFTIADNADIRTGAGFAFSFWVSCNGGGTNALVSKYTGTGTTSEYNMLRVSKDIRVYMDAYDRGFGETSLTTATLAPDLMFPSYDVWYHIVIDFNGYVMKFYRDGKFITTLHYPYGNDAQSGGGFCLGRQCGSETYSSDKFTKMGFWKSAASGENHAWSGGYLLGQSNVDILYNDGLGLRYNSLPESLKGGLIGYWNLNEASGNGLDSHGSNPLVAAGDSLPSYDTGPAISSAYVTKTLATTSLKPTLHLGSRNRYIAAGREQSL